MKLIRHLLSIISSALPLIIFTSQQTNSEPSLLHLLHHEEERLLPKSPVVNAGDA